MKPLAFVHVPAEKIVVGDTVRFWVGTVRITALRPYTGPYGFCFGVAEYEPKLAGGAISLTRGDTFETLREGVAS